MLNVGLETLSNVRGRHDEGGTSENQLEMMGGVSTLYLEVVFYGFKDL